MEEIEKYLDHYCMALVSKYEGLQMAYGYCKERGVYLVSYYLNDNLLNNDRFVREARDFENLMNIKYKDKAPLFCDNDELFKMPVDHCLIYREYISQDLY